MEAVSYYDYSEYPADVQAQFAGMTRKPGPETILSYDYDAFNYPPGTSHKRQVSLSRIVRLKWMETLTDAGKASFLSQHEKANIAISEQIDKEMEARRTQRYTTMALSTVGMLGAGVLAPAVFAGAPAAAAAAPAAGAVAPVGVTAAGLTAAKIATLATAGYGIYRGISDQQIQKEALDMQKEYLAAQTEALRTRTEINIPQPPWPQTEPAQQPTTVIYEKPAASQLSNYMPLAIAAFAAFLIFK